ncbi:hypothetical protein GCM10009801_32520 [Streptomyces albiaxialis]|uniref:DUF2637 domain-containing protein n=1 Tax=Streptomyces albiaxialis TaxID=329523 RepID=A0ABN2VY58_9ACTN
MQGVQLTRIHRILIAVVVTGAVVIAAIGFAGSFSAVRDLAEKKGFGAFAPYFPIGVDAGIVVLLALDLLLTWIRIPFPLLRQTAWLLTAATIAFNGAAAWPDPLGVGMHAVIPVLFVVTVEAARHAIGRVADITADKHMEGVRLSRWLLAFPSTFRLWRRMKLWELRSYDEVIRMEQDRLVYETRLRARYGRAWRRKAPVEALMPLKLARYGVPLAKSLTTVPTPPEALQAAAPTTGPGPGPELLAEPVPATATASTPGAEQAPESAPLVKPEPEPAPAPEPQATPHPEPAPEPEPGPAPAPVAEPAPPTPEPAPTPEPEPEPAYAVSAAVAEQHDPGPRVTVPVTPGGRRRTLSSPAVPDDQPVGIPDGIPREEMYFEAYRQYVAAQGIRPNARQLARTLHEDFGVTTADGGLLSESYLLTYMREFKDRYNTEMGLAG